MDELPGFGVVSELELLEHKRVEPIGMVVVARDDEVVVGADLVEQLDLLIEVVEPGLS